MSVRFTILGCGSSGGVPRAGVGWGACDPSEPKNYRRRCSLLVQKRGPHGVTTVLVDTSPDMRQQMLDADVTHIDGVIYTHDHADHTNGIDDLRPFAVMQRRRIDVYMDDATARQLAVRFGYCFRTPPGSEYPPILQAHRIEAGQGFSINGAGGAIDVLPISVQHGGIEALGLRFGGLVYLPDVSDIPVQAFDAFTDMGVWIVDALRYTPHVSHFTVAQALDWIDRFKPGRAILTNLHIDLDYQTLQRELPARVEPAYDGMVIEAVD